MKSGIYAEAGRGGQPTGIPARAMTIGAHPDDAEFGAGGTLATWAAAGCEVTMLIVTDGSKGSWNPAIDHQELINQRKQEQHVAADVLGAATPVMLGHTDGELEYSMALREEICLWIRRIRPDVVLTHDPWQRYQLHPDHRITGLAAIDGVVAARDHLFFPDQLVGDIDKHRPEWIYLWSADEADHWVDITETFDVKIEALLSHSSQGVNTMGDAHRTETESKAFRARIEGWARRQSQPEGLGLAESFKVLKP